MSSASPSPLSPSGIGMQSQSQGTGPDSASGGVLAQLQKTLASLEPSKLDRIFSLAEETREEDGNYLNPRDNAPHDEARSTGGFDLMPYVIGG